MNEAVKQATRTYLLLEFLVGEDDSALQDSTPLITGGILDSIGVVRLATFLETQFGISLDSSDLSVQHFDTIDSISNTVLRRLS